MSVQSEKCSAGVLPPASRSPVCWILWRGRSQLGSLCGNTLDRDRGESLRILIDQFLPQHLRNGRVFRQVLRNVSTDVGVLVGEPSHELAAICQKTEERSLERLDAAWEQGRHETRSSFSVDFSIDSRGGLRVKCSMASFPSSAQLDTPGAAASVADPMRQSLPWAAELPPHLRASACAACVNLASIIATTGLDENRQHHGFTIIVGDPHALQRFGQSGFNPFKGNEVLLVNEEGVLPAEAVDKMRRNAFNAAGAIVVDGSCAKVVASGWFVSDIWQGGSSVGVRSRSVKAIANEAGGCYVIEVSEDSNGELMLHFRTNNAKLSGRVMEVENASTVATPIGGASSFEGTLTRSNTKMSL